MSDLRKRYFAALKEIALGMPVGPFKNGFFDELWEAFSEFSRLFLMFWFWMLSLITYPVSIFFFAAIAVRMETRREERKRAIYKEFARNDWRKQ